MAESEKSPDQKSVGELVRKQENEYTRGSTTISKYVTFSMYDTISRIEAYLNSKHITGETDSRGRPKPFLNISVAAANIWFRATDIDRRHIKLRAKNSKQWINSLFANIVVQDWMKREGFGQFLNEWGRVLSRYGSALVKFVENSSGLHISVTPWGRLIVDSVDADAAPKIEVLELSEAQLRERVETHGYDEAQVKALISAKKTRETIDRRQKDSKSDYYKLYEVHGNMPLSYLKEQKEGYGWQMHVISFVGKRAKKGEKEYDDFTLFAGEEDGDPYVLTHLIKEDGRTLAIGPVEYLFDAQWMQNHSAKTVKDQLDIASKLLMQTADPQFLGRNVLDQLEHGDILVHMPNQPLTQVHNASHDIVSWQNYAIQFRDAGRELVGITEAMLGTQPKAGTAWRLQEALLNESYSLFELMTENKGLYIEQMLRERILPYLFKKYDTDEEISALLEKNDIEKIDRRFIRSEAIRRVNKRMIKSAMDIMRGQDLDLVAEDAETQILQNEEKGVQESLQELDGLRYVKPSEVSWKKQFEGIEWDIDIEVTPEAHNVQEMLTTISTALKTVTDPNFENNPRAQALVGKILELTSAMSPIEYYALPSAARAGSPGGGEVALPKEQQRNIQK